MKKLKYDDIKSFVEGNSDCKLITKDYKNVDTKMEFSCKCGETFLTTFDKFRARNKRQCNRCSIEKMTNERRLSYEDVKNFIEVESDSGCVLLSDEYITANKKLDIRCACGNVFQTKLAHFKGSFQRQCPTCGTERRAKEKRFSKEHVESVLKENECELIGEYKNINTYISIKCSCGNEFKTLFTIFRDYDVRSCKSCRAKEKITSKGELKIENWLIENNITYETQFTFEDLKFVRNLKFDFAILNKFGDVKLLIEYDGKQHFGLGLFSGDEEEMLAQYNFVKQSDYTKNEYCFKNSIPLVRIPYNKYAKIHQILTTLLL